MTSTTLLGRAVRGFNTGIVALLDIPLLGPLLGKGFVEIEYVGRRSGQTFRTPVNYLKKDGDLVIGVAMPDRKRWWRNFSSEGAPILLHLRDGDRRGHATARRDEKGRVTVRVRLDDPS
ncbi:hypothetical protein [Nocardia sp. NBC_01329]|uniref:hypothetical protein n=1 Tax=Nocardia sp. NBC_01329 TaxID=2903594 RepID=UPI002E166BB3|nr:hypothetical protein OG405_16910 [Nocardia sp. NBC_01329]